MTVAEEVEVLRQRLRHVEETSARFRTQVLNMLQQQQRCDARSLEAQFTDAIRRAGDDSPQAASELHQWMTRCSLAERRMEQAQSEASYWKGQCETYTSRQGSGPRRGSPHTRKKSFALDDVPIETRHEGAADAQILRRKHAALQRRLKQLEEEHGRHLAAREETIEALLSQTHDLKCGLQAAEQRRVDAEAALLRVQQELVELRTSSKHLEHRSSVLDTEKKLFLKTAQELQVALQYQTASEDEKHRGLHQILLDENRGLKETVQHLHESVEGLKTVSRSREKEIALLSDSLTQAMRALEEQRRLVQERAVAASDTHDCSVESAATVFQRLVDVVTVAESTAHTCAQGGVMELSKRVNLAETLSKTVEQYSAMIAVKEKQLRALMAEIESCEVVGWRLTSHDARRALLDVTMESHHQPPPARTVVLRTEGEWKEVRDTRLDVVYYVTENIKLTDFFKKK